MFFIGLLTGITAYLLYASSRLFCRVEEGSVAVLTQFGAAVHDADGKLRVLGAGLHLKAPWQKALPVSVRELNLDLAGEKGGRTAMTDDGTVLRFDSVLRMQPERETLSHFLFDLRAPLEHLTGLFTCLLRNEIANFVPTSPAGTLVEEAGGSYGLIRRERQELNQRIEQFCHQKISGKYGVRFNAVDLTDILPPDELADALNAVMNAQTEAEAAINHAQAECTQKVLASERGVAIAKAKGAGVEKEILTLGAALGELQQRGALRDYVERRRAEVETQSKTLFVRRTS